MKKVRLRTGLGNSRRLNFAERWLRDGLEACRPAAYYQIVDIDMTRAKSTIERAKQLGVRVTYTHLLVRAVALTLAAHPELHVLICGSRVFSPSRVDIGLSIAGETFVAPVLVLEGAEKKDVLTLGEEIRSRVPEVQSADRKMLELLRRWGWIVPFGFMRRNLLRMAFRSYLFRTKGSGTFQVSVMANIDQAIAPMFSTSAILVAGRVTDRVVAENGLPVVRPMSRFTLSADHKVWDGRAGERFLLTLQAVLSSDSLREEVFGEKQNSPAEITQAA